MSLSALILAAALGGTPGTAAAPGPDHALGHSGCAACSNWRSTIPSEARHAVALVDLLNGRSPSEAPPVQAASGTPSEEELKAKREQERLERDIRADEALGKQYAEEIAKELKFSEDQEMVARVNRIGAQLSAIANTTAVEVSWGDSRQTKFDYKFYVVANKDVNAFSVPGGHIYIYEGLINFAESDDELAGVVAHEIAHAAFRHVAVLRRQSSLIDILQIPIILAALISGSPDAMNAATAANAAGQSFRSGWSLNAETSADFGAVQYMIRSDFSPVGVLTFMERLAFRDAAGIPIDWGIYATHPPSRERADAIQKQLAAFNVPVKRSQVSSSMRAAAEIGNEQAIELSFGKTLLHEFRGEGAIQRAEEAARRLNVFMDRVPSLDELGRNGYVLRGGNRPLFEVRQQDLLPGEDLDKEFTEVLNRIRSVVFDLNYRLRNRIPSRM